MRRLIIHGDPGIRTGAVIEYDDREVVCFGISRNGDYHGPDRVQLWCTVGTEDERVDFDTREFIPHFLEVDRVEADAVTVHQRQGDPATQ